MAEFTTQLSILTLNVSELNSPIKIHLSNWIKKEDPTIGCLQKTHLFNTNKHRAYGEKAERRFTKLMSPETSRSGNTYIRQSRLQA
jgi:exonuclease III